jgi:hypothetical protein
LPSRPNLSISAPLGIEKIGQVALANNEGDDFVIGTLSATDPDTDTTTNALTFTIDVVTLVIGKSDLTIDNSGTLDPDIGRSFIV